MVTACAWATAVAKSTGTASSGGPSNCNVTEALPSVNASTVTVLELSGAVPAIRVPPSPTEMGCGSPPTTTLSPDPSVAFIAFTAAAASGSTKTLRFMTLAPVELVNDACAPGEPTVGLGGFPTENGSGDTALISATGTTRLV